MTPHNREQAIIAIENLPGHKPTTSPAVSPGQSSSHAQDPEKGLGNARVEVKTASQRRSLCERITSLLADYRGSGDKTGSEALLADVKEQERSAPLLKTVLNALFLGLGIVLFVGVLVVIVVTNFTSDQALPSRFGDSELTPTLPSVAPQPLPAVNPGVPAICVNCKDKLLQESDIRQAQIRGLSTTTTTSMLSTTSTRASSTPGQRLSPSQTGQWRSGSSRRSLKPSHGPRFRRTTEDHVVAGRRKRHRHVIRLTLIWRICIRYVEK